MFASGARNPLCIEGLIRRNLVTKPSPESQTMLSCPRSENTPSSDASSSNVDGSACDMESRNRQGGGVPPADAHAPSRSRPCSNSASSASARSIPVQRNLSAGSELPLCSATLNLRTRILPSRTSSTFFSRFNISRPPHPHAHPDAGRFRIRSAFTRQTRKSISYSLAKCARIF